MVPLAEYYLEPQWSCLLRNGSILSELRHLYEWPSGKPIQAVNERPRRKQCILKFGRVGRHLIRQNVDRL